MGISPRALTELFESAGHPLTERRLTDWRAKRWIPDVCRAERPAGTGRGARYEWPDSEIIAQVFTLLSMLELRGRMETASVLAWFSGFDVPRDDIRDLWVAFEAVPWEKTLRWALAGEEGSIQDAVEILVTGERHRQQKKKDGYSDGFVDFMARMTLDPAFDVRTDLPSGRLAKILTDVPRFAEMASMLSADTIRGLAVLAQDYWSRPKLIKVIQSIPDEMLAQAHADVRYLLSPYRAWVRSSVRRSASGTEFDDTALWMGPRLAWRLGRFLMLLDIALRRLGYGAELDATIAMLRDLAAKDETRDVVNAFKDDWQALASLRSSGQAENAASVLYLERGKDPAYGHVAEIFQSVGPALEDLWLPRLRLTLAEAAQDGVAELKRALGQGGPSGAPVRRFYAARRPATARTDLSDV